MAVYVFAKCPVKGCAASVNPSYFMASRGLAAHAGDADYKVDFRLPCGHNVPVTGTEVIDDTVIVEPSEPDKESNSDA